MSELSATALDSAPTMTTEEVVALTKKLNYGTWRYQKSWNPLHLAEYKVWVVKNMTPIIYKDHVDAYASCCCPSGPAPFGAWIGVTTVPLKLCALVGESIELFGSCHGRIGSW